VAARDLDALLAFVPDAAIDAAIALKKRRDAEAASAGAASAGGPPPPPLAFADVLEATAATGGGANGWAWTDCGVNGDEEACAVLAEDSPPFEEEAFSARSGRLRFFHDDDGEREAAAEAEARGAAGDDGGDAIAGLLQQPSGRAADGDGHEDGEGPAWGVRPRQASPLSSFSSDAPTTAPPPGGGGRPAAPRPYLDTYAQRHLVHAAPVSVRALSAMPLSPASYRARLAVRSAAGEEAVLTFSLSRMRALEPRYRGAPVLVERWFLTGVVGEASPSPPSPAPSASAAAAPLASPFPNSPPPPETPQPEKAAPAPAPSASPAAQPPPPPHPSAAIPPEAVVEAQLAALRDGCVAAAFALCAPPAARGELGPLPADFAARLAAPDGRLRCLIRHARAATVERMQVSDTHYLARVRVLEGVPGGAAPAPASASTDEGEGEAADDAADDDRPAPPVWREFLWVVSRQGEDGPQPNCWMTDAIRPLFAPPPQNPRSRWAA